MVFTHLLRMSIRLFEEAAHTEKYQLYRPSYPMNLVNYIVAYAKEKRPALEAALDIGCGSGQGTTLFAQHFKRVTGVDVSAQQIKRASEAYAEELPNTSFIVSEAENLPVSSSSVDLITCAQSFHWFNEKKFFKEAERVLCPGGTLAVFGYDLPIYKNEGVNEALFEIYEGILGRYWSTRRRLLENHYKDVTMPFTDVQREIFVTHDSGTLSSLANYITSWSAYEAYRKEHPNSLSLVDIKQRLLEGAKSEKDAETTSLIWRREYFLLIGRKD